MNSDLTTFLTSLTEDQLIPLIRRHSTSSFRGIGDHFSCPNKSGHKRGDRRPSASIYRISNGRLKWKCNACGAGSDIIDFYKHAANHETSTFPEIVKALGDELNIEMPVLGTEQDGKKLLFAIAKASSDYVTDNANISYLNKRKITPQTAAQLRIGSVPNFQTYKNHMLDKFTSDQVQDAGYLNAMVFNERSIIMTIHNHYGQPIAFVARNMEFKPDSDDPKYRNKYCNTRSNNIYSKGQTFFMLAQTRKTIIEQKKAYVVEGYLDGVTMYQSDIHIVAALGGVAFTKEHLKELKNLGVTEITFCWDIDPVGIFTTIKNINDVFNDVFDIRVRFMILPDAKDPDEFIRKHSTSAFMALETFDAIEYLIRVLPKDDLDIYFINLFKQMSNSIIGPHKLEGYVNQISITTSIRKEYVSIALRRFMMSKQIDDMIRKNVESINDAVKEQDPATVLLHAKQIVRELDISDKSLDSIISENIDSLNKEPIIDLGKNKKIYIGDINHVKVDNPFSLAVDIKEQNESIQVIVHFHYNEKDGIQYTLRQQAATYKLTDDHKKYLKEKNIMLIQSATLTTPISICTQVTSKDPNAKCVIITKDIASVSQLESIPSDICMII